MLNKDAELFFSDLSDPMKWMPNIRSIILLATYAFDQNSRYRSTRKLRRGKTARTYAYYPVVRQLALELVAIIEEAGFKAIDGQQLPIKHVAHKMGLGSYGHNGILYTREFGSFVGLRCILTDADLEPDELSPPEMSCDTCGRCMNACPTEAIYEPYKVNPRLCLNPTSRREDDIAPEIRDKMSNWISGCDICQEVCPVNRKLKPREPHPIAGFYPENHASHKILGGLPSKTPKLLEDVIKSKRNHTITRNALIALGNIGDEKIKLELESMKQYEEMQDFDTYISYAINRISTRLKKMNETCD
jgi:epoxyqueuosine reductase